MERIAADDKDFSANFALMINLATKLVNEFEPRVSQMSAEQDESLLNKISSNMGKI